MPCRGKAHRKFTTDQPPTELFIAMLEFYILLHRRLFCRYVNQKKYDQLKEMMYDGAVQMLDHGQASDIHFYPRKIVNFYNTNLFVPQGPSGADLAKLFVTVLNEMETLPNDEIFEEISK